MQCSVDTFQIWRSSVVFKASHKRPDTSSEVPEHNVPVIKSQLVKAEIVAELTK